MWTGAGQAKARINARLRRAELGNFGDCEPVGKGVSEMRVHYGPGYRVYWMHTGTSIHPAGGWRQTGLAGEGIRPQEQRNAVNLRICRKNGKRSQFSAEIHAANVTALRFNNSFVRSSAG